MIDLQEVLDSVKDYNPMSSPGVVEDFIRSTLHKDFTNELTARIEQMRDFYEDCKSNEYIETRGGIKALRLVKGIFDDILANSIADLESKQEENKDEQTL